MTGGDVDPQEVVYIGIGEEVDPMPEVPKTTKFWVTAAACTECGCPGRQLVPEGERLVLHCVECGKASDGGLEARHLPQVTFVYWCRFSRFPTDMVELSAPDRAQLEEALKQLGSENDIPFYAMIITSGLCGNAFTCIAPGCPYKAGSSQGPGFLC